MVNQIFDHLILKTPLTAANRPTCQKRQLLMYMKKQDFDKFILYPIKTTYDN